MTGIKRISRAGGKQVYRIAFSFKGVECRETLALPHSKANDAYCERLRAEVLGKIGRGEFRYGDHFPDSPRAAVFGSARARLLKDALESYRDRVEHTFAPSTFAATRKAIDNVLVPWCGDKRVTDLKPSDIRDWVGLQQSSLKRIMNVLLPLRAVLDEAVADEVIDANPFGRLKLAKLVPEAKRRSTFEPQPYTADELLALLRNVPLPERLAFQLMAYTGIRTGELIALRWPRVDLEAGTMRVTETTTDGQDKDSPKTQAGVRSIPLLPAAREALLLMRQYTLLGGDRVTVNAKGEPWDYKRLALRWKAAHKGTGVEYRNPYVLRHTWASNLLSEGENVALISKLLGHRTIQMTMQHYARWVSKGEELGLDRPPRRYGMTPLWGQEKAA